MKLSLTLLLQLILEITIIQKCLGNIDVGLNQRHHKSIEDLEILITINPKSSQKGFQNITQLLNVPSSIASIFVVTGNDVEVIQTQRECKLTETRIVHNLLSQIG